MSTQLFCFNTDFWLHPLQHFLPQHAQLQNVVLCEGVHVVMELVCWSLCNSIYTEYVTRTNNRSRVQKGKGHLTSAAGTGAVHLPLRCSLVAIALCMLLVLASALIEFPPKQRQELKAACTLQSVGACRQRLAR